MSSQANRLRAQAFSNQVRARRLARRDNQPQTFINTGERPDKQTLNQIEPTALSDIKAVTNDQEKDIVDKDDFNAPQPRNNEMATKPSTSQIHSNQSNLLNAYSKCWSTVDYVNMAPVRYEVKSYFTPCSIKLFEILHHMDDCLDSNEKLRYSSPHYFSLPVRIYYAILFYVQIFRAKEASGKLSQKEDSWLRSFLRRFKDTSCVIAGPLVPFFGNIVSVLPSDDQFEYVFPDVPRNSLYESMYTAKRTTAVIHGNYFLLPNVPALCQMMHTFCNVTRLTHRDAEETKLFNQLEQFVPFNTTKDQSLAGIPFPAESLEGTPNTIVNQALANPALSYALSESRMRMLEIHSYYRRSRLADIPTVSSDEDWSFQGPSDLTLLNSSEDLDWFQTCIDMAAMQSSFFEDGTNLSAIPVIGGEAALVQCHLTPQNRPSTPTAAAGKNSFYPRYWSNTTATMLSTSSLLDQDQQFEAAYALTNATLSWKTDHGSVGSIEALDRKGPYWNNKKYNYEEDSPKHVTAGLSTMIQNMFYRADGV